ncbi:unnamed protein product [Pleuronectes platessa]|uniref:Protein kinase domain-containing protein n=1 Tax=Pleuronectes platessa TaxID=8262 RepID=A0A9N7UTN2_PLEPL|nr:unnamed protein product [Pleuronectes platessa]
MLSDPRTLQTQTHSSNIINLLEVLSILDPVKTTVLLTALEALRGLRVTHNNLKPDNLMLVNHHNQPFRIKLIDFGLSQNI